jgi:osmotically-inducible protein OsmY
VHVNGSDIILDGSVKTEAVRQRTNDIVMAVPGVRSVSNWLQLTD